MAPTTRKRAASAKPQLDQQEAAKRPRKVPAKKPKPAKAPGRNRKMEPEDDACAEEPDEEEMAMGEEDDAGEQEQEQQGREEAPAARKRVAQPSRVRHTADGDREPEFHGGPFPDQEARAKWPHRYQRGTPRRPDEEEDLKARCHYRSAKVDDTVYSLNDDVYVKDDKEPQLTSRKRRKSADNDIGDKSDSCLQKKLNMSVQDMVKETEQMPLAQFSPSHSPSMKRARSLGQDQLASQSSCQPAVPSPSQSSQCASVAQLADELEQSLDTRPEVPEAGEPAQATVAAGAGVPAQAVEAAVFPDATAPAAAVDLPLAPMIEHLEGLSQLSEALFRKPMNYCGPDQKKVRKSLLTAGADGKRYQTGINFYERARTATDERFWSIEQQDLYTSVYGVKNFAQNKWIDWDGIRPYEEFQYVEKNCHDIGLHRVMAARHDWHVETIKQFFATFYINPSRTSLTWMTGINRKITVTKRFWEEILLDLSVHDGRNDYPKIKGSLTDKEEEQFRNANPTLINATNRMLRTTIFPKAGDKTRVHNENKLILYHILFGKPFDVVDMMLREIQKTRRDTRMLIPYAPYIMLLIKCATREEFVPESGGTAWFKHPKYNIMPQKPRQPWNIRASKSKQPFRVPPLPALVAPPLVPAAAAATLAAAPAVPPLVPAVAGAAATLAAAAAAVPPLVPAVAGAAATLAAAAPAVPPLAPVRDPVAAEPPQPVDRHAQPPCQGEVGQCLLECLKHRSKEECLKELLSEVPRERTLPVVWDYLASLPLS